MSFYCFKVGDKYVTLRDIEVEYETSNWECVVQSADDPDFYDLIVRQKHELQETLNSMFDSGIKDVYAVELVEGGVGTRIYRITK